MAVCDLLDLFSGLVGGEDNQLTGRGWGGGSCCPRLRFLLLRRGFVLSSLSGWVFHPAREAHYLVFFRYVIFPPIVPL